MYRLSQDSHITIDLSTRTLTLYQGQQIVHSYPIAIGKSATPTPLGHWAIANKKIITYDSVFGTRWLGLTAHGYGIHGTNNPDSIGTSASLGCIRLHNRDVEELFPLVPIGTPVTIVGHLPTPGQPVTPPSTQPSTAPLTHRIMSGDTLWKIAQRYGISLAQLQQLNPKINPQQLPIGQLLVLHH